jgi:TM2 domain-containing membrane protein YozV
METTEKSCPYCAETIKLEAIKCKHCGELLDNINKGFTSVTPTWVPSPQPKWSAGVAGLLSFIIPGAGQMYKGAVGEGIAWFFFTIFGYMLFILPGVIIHLVCIFNATQGDPYVD